MGEASIM